MKKFITVLVLLLCVSVNAFAAGSASITLLMPPSELSENIQIDFISVETKNTTKSVILTKNAGYTNVADNIKAGSYKLEASLIGSNGLPYTSSEYIIDVGTEAITIVDDNTMPVIISAEKITPSPSPAPSTEPSPEPSPEPTEKEKEPNFILELIKDSWFTLTLLIAVIAWWAIRKINRGGFLD